MIYPRLKCEDKRNTVVCSLTIQKMKAMRKEKHTYQEIADKFEVCKRTAWMHTATAKLVSNSKKTRNQAILQEHNEKYANDPEYRKKIRLSSSSSFKRRYDNDPQVRKYVAEKNKKYDIILAKKYSTWSYNCARGIHETTNRKNRCKNGSGKCKCSCHKITNIHNKIY